MRVGFEFPNQPSIPEQFWLDFQASGANVAKTRLYHPLSVYERAMQINPDCKFLLRPTDEGRLNAAEQLGKARPLIEELHNAWIPFWFQTWNEPDHTDGRYGGPLSREGAREFRAKLTIYVYLLRAQFPWLKLVSPPLVALGQSTSVFDEECGDVFRQHDYIGEHAYWQGPNNHLSPDWGLRIKRREAFYPDHRFIVAEIGDASNDNLSESMWTSATIRYLRIVQCLEVLASLGYVDAACIFIGRGSTEHWRGFWPDDEAIKLIGATYTTGEEIMGDDLKAQLAMLANQNALITEGFKQILQGRFTGADGLAGTVVALQGGKPLGFEVTFPKA